MLDCPVPELGLPQSGIGKLRYRTEMLDSGIHAGGIGLDANAQIYVEDSSRQHSLQCRFVQPRAAQAAVE